MKYELLEKIVPDHEITIQGNSVIGVDNGFIKLLHKNPDEILYDIEINSFFEQFENNETDKNFSEQFINDLQVILHDKGKAILILNGSVENKQTKALYLFLLKTQQIGQQVKIQLYNLISLTKMFKNLFSTDLWTNLRTTFITKSSLFVQKQLYCAHQALSSIYSLSNLSLFAPDSQKKFKNYDLGELLFYFNPKNQDKQLSENSGLATLKTGVNRSMNKLSLSFINELSNYDCIMSNSLESNVIIQLA